MAFSHIQIAIGSTHGPLLKGCLNQLEQGRQSLFDLIATMQLMIDGDGSNVSHYAEVTARYGFVDTTQAKAAFEELLSVKSKIDGDGSVDHVAAALEQAFNKFR